MSSSEEKIPLKSDTNYEKILELLMKEGGLFFGDFIEKGVCSRGTVNTNLKKAQKAGHVEVRPDKLRINRKNSDKVTNKTVNRYFITREGQEFINVRLGNSPHTTIIKSDDDELIGSIMDFYSKYHISKNHILEALNIYQILRFDSRLSREDTQEDLWKVTYFLAKNSVENYGSEAYLTKTQFYEALEINLREQKWIEYALEWITEKYEIAQLNLNGKTYFLNYYGEVGDFIKTIIKQGIKDLYNLSIKNQKEFTIENLITIIYYKVFQKYKLIDKSFKIPSFQNSITKLIKIYSDKLLYISYELPELPEPLEIPPEIEPRIICQLLGEKLTKTQEIQMLEEFLLEIQEKYGTVQFSAIKKRSQELVESGQAPVEEIVKSLMFFGYSYFLAKRFREVIECFEEILRFKPEDPFVKIQSYRKLAYAYSQIGADQKAEAYYQESKHSTLEAIRDTDGAGQIAYFEMLGELHLLHFSHQEAISCFHKLVDLNPIALKWLGIFYALNKDYEDAIISFHGYLEHHPSDADTLRRIGQSYTNLGDYPKALEYQRKLKYVT